MAMKDLFGIDVSRRSDKNVQPDAKKISTQDAPLTATEESALASELSAEETLLPEGGDGKNYMLFYCGPGYENRTRGDVEHYAAVHGMQYIYWGSDEAYGYTGMYNGDTLVAFRDFASLPEAYLDDARRHAEIIPEVGKRIQAERYAHLSAEEAAHMSDEELSDAALAYQEGKE